MDLKQIVGIIMVFSVPLSLIIGLVYYLVDMKRNAFRLRSEIISGGVGCAIAYPVLKKFHDDGAHSWQEAAPSLRAICSSRLIGAASSTDDVSWER